MELSQGDKDKLVKIVLTDRTGGHAHAGRKRAARGRRIRPWQVTLDSSNVDDLLYSFSSLQAERTIDEQPRRPRQIRAEAAAGNGHRHLGGREAHTLFLGNKTDAGNTYYLQVKGDPKVYTVWMNNGAALPLDGERPALQDHHPGPQL